MNLLFLGDSLTFHGPDASYPPGDPRLWPNVAAAALDAQVDLVAGIGWTARDAWWAVTRDPMVWGEYLPRADALVIGVGGMDALPAAIPTYLRQGIAYVRPGWLRKRVRSAYEIAAPRAIGALRGPLRQLPQRATDQYLTRVVQGVRSLYPEMPIVAITPAPTRSKYYPTDRFHDSSVAAARRWAADNHVLLVDVSQPVQQGLDDGSANPDGLHWGWATHAQVGGMVADGVRKASVGW